MSTMQHVSFQRWLNQTLAGRRDSPVAAEPGSRAFTDLVERIARRDLHPELRTLRN